MPNNSHKIVPIIMLNFFIFFRWNIIFGPKSLNLLQIVLSVIVIHIFICSLNWVQKIIFDRDLSYSIGKLCLLVKCNVRRNEWSLNRKTNVIIVTILIETHQYTLCEIHHYIIFPTTQNKNMYILKLQIGNISLRTANSDISRTIETTTDTTINITINATTNFTQRTEYKWI